MYVTVQKTVEVHKMCGLGCMSSSGSPEGLNEYIQPIFSNYKSYTHFDKKPSLERFEHVFIEHE